MPITKTQLARRKKHLGSSDMAAIMGLDPYRNAYDVWLDKTGRLEANADNPSTYAGTMFEDGILNHAEAELGKLVRNQYRSAKSKGLPLGANIDAILVKTDEPIEVKTAGLYGLLNEPWGDAGTDQVPDRVIIQAHVHLLCTDQELCHIAAFLGGRGFQMFRIPRDREIIDAIAARASDFWEKNVEADTPPTEMLPHPALIKRVRREPASIVPIAQTLIDEWLESKETEKAARQARELKETAILTHLGDAEAGETEKGLFTYLEQSRGEYTVKATTYRVARFKFNKGEK